MRSDRIGPSSLTRFSATTVRRVLDLNRVTMRQRRRRDWPTMRNRNSRGQRLGRARCNRQSLGGGDVVETA